MRQYTLPRLPQGFLQGRRALVRVDFNVPLVGGRIVDDFRITMTLPTLLDLEHRGAVITILGHLTEKKRHRSFAPMQKALERVCGRKILLARSIKEAVFLQQSIAPKTWILLENLRVFPGEEKNSAPFARELAGLGDLYINEAFSQSHRPYASIVRLPHVLPAYAGPLFAREVERLSEALTPAHPFLCIVGGVKFKTKVAVLDRFMRKADEVFIGGGLANTFLDAAGYEVGVSPIEEDAEQNIRRKFLSQKNLILPFDVVVKGHKSKSVEAVSLHDMIYDAGPETVRILKEKISSARLVLWNGPLGFIEKGYGRATEDLIRALAGAKAKTIVGGGDTLAVIHRYKLEKKFYHISTGGGAMLEFLGRGTLPGIDALLAGRKRR
jgi:phosphoglycerate kinase